jgi:pimeloyl-ACP methyl ester carboxylesterase
MWRWAKRAAIAAVVLVVLYFGLGGIAAAGFIGWLLTPGNVDWSGPVQQDPFELGYRGDPQQALGLAFSDVTIPTELGGAPAWLVPAATGSPKLWAIYVHGIGGLRENGYRQLSVLHEAAIPTLMITYRNDDGAPAAPDHLFSFGLSEWRDLDAAVDWSLANGAERIVLVAESMGGAIAGQFLINSASADKVEALVLDAPALDFTAVIEGRVGAWGLPMAPQLASVALWASRLVRVDLSKAQSIDVVEAFPGPVFLAHGSADQLVPVAISDELVARRSGPTTYLRTGANHLLSWKENPERYREMLLAFLEKLPGR